MAPKKLRPGILRFGTNPIFTGILEQYTEEYFKLYDYTPGP
jgi:hypothetical protein